MQFVHRLQRLYDPVMSHSHPTSKAHSSQHSDANERILVRSTNWLGDAVMTLPALGWLRRSAPDAHISVLSKPNLMPLFLQTGLADAVIPYRLGESSQALSWFEFRRLYQTLKVARFTKALLFQNAFEAALLAAAARIPQRIGFATQGRRFLLTDPLERPTQERHESLDYLQIVDRALNTRGTVERTQQPPSSNSLYRPLTASPNQIAAAESLLRENGVEPGEPFVMLNAGATNSRAKRWPERHFAGLADLLIKERGCRIVLAGSSDEREIAAHVEALMSEGAPVNLAGMTDLPVLIGLLSLAAVVVSNDTGTAHLSSVLGRPTLTIFGPTNEFATAPQGPLSQIIRTPGIECERCMLRDCPIDHRCLIRISPEEVFHRIERLLAGV